MIQNLYNCQDYTPNTNLNLTCRNCKRCVILYGETCYEYREKGEPPCYVMEGRTVQEKQP